ncbi:CopG family transcriptional regulator [Paenibacillus sp. FSL R7-269]|uniref:CopG family transcriptional regulator n=1 Tax=Paenibacillus sp. FSL R7-269 TaxID=1226755 RepID=UPI001F3C755E|nr:CopG family transcriptional regulator [Paenibacillus sp. FSL R7-269]
MKEIIDFLLPHKYIYHGHKKWGEAMSSKKMGRPLSDNPKSELIRVRVDQEILSKLDACTEKLQTTRSDVIRKGIEKVFDELQK